MRAARETDRRNYYRLKDGVHVEYRHATETEVQNRENSGNEEKDEVHLQLDSINRQISPLLKGIRDELPVVAQYLEGLNQKIDILSGMIFFEHFNSQQINTAFKSANTFDISEGGFSFDTKDHIEPYSFLFCRLIIVGFRYGMETYGKVTNSREHHREDGQKVYRCGVEFPFLNEHDRKYLARYIMARQRELIRGNMG
ncbi:MAG: PilZ domain-containing protein [Gammaproteobacteria bacterium]|nr:PilZ domain-containing protein [Gammaproteobacteria bacterium]MDH5731521.1 PilZ domain-containing protein [Gammaproteobacteria bacterium]